MSEEAKEATEGKKKKGKLPVILALVLVLGGGGFFMMKGKGAPPKVEVKAGTTEPLEKEFLVNLAGSSNTYLRAELALELREGFTKEELDKDMPAIRDAINQIFRSKTLQQVGASQTDELRKEIAESVNSILIGNMKEEEKKKQADFEKAAGEKKGAKKPDEKKDEGNADSKESSEDWPTPAGPVLDVYFTSFTTQ